jgi:hypothetical protein
LKRNQWFTFFIGIIVLGVLGLIVKESFSGKGVADYQDKFEEIGYFRNENNTGPIRRVYAFRTKEQDPEVLKSFANLLPHTKYGRTLVFFVAETWKEPVVLSPESPYFPELLRSHLFAKYEKTPMGEQQLELVSP